MRKIFAVIILSIIFFFYPFFHVYVQGKRITVDLVHQTLYAWDNDQVVYQTAVSTGLPQTPTITSTFSIYAKVPSQRMSEGSDAYGYYDLPNVPKLCIFQGVIQSMEHTGTIILVNQ